MPYVHKKRPSRAGKMGKRPQKLGPAKPVWVWVTEPELATFDRIAALQGFQRSTLIRQLIIEYVAKHSTNLDSKRAPVLQCAGEQDKQHAQVPNERRDHFIPGAPTE